MNLLELANHAEDADATKDKRVMFFYLAKMMENIAEMLRDNGKDGDQADQLAFVLSEYAKETKR